MNPLTDDLQRYMDRFEAAAKLHPRSPSMFGHQGEFEEALYEMEAGDPILQGEINREDLLMRLLEKQGDRDLLDRWLFFRELARTKNYEVSWFLMIKNFGERENLL